MDLAIAELQGRVDACIDGPLEADGKIKTLAHVYAEVAWATGGFHPIKATLEDAMRPNEHEVTFVRRHAYQGDGIESFRFPSLPAQQHEKIGFTSTPSRYLPGFADSDSSELSADLQICEVLLESIESNMFGKGQKDKFMSAIVIEIVKRWLDVLDDGRDAAENDMKAGHAIYFSMKRHSAVREGAARLLFEERVLAAVIPVAMQLCERLGHAPNMQDDAYCVGLLLLQITLDQSLGANVLPFAPEILPRLFLLCRAYSDTPFASILAYRVLTGFIAASSSAVVAYQHSHLLIGEFTSQISLRDNNICLLLLFGTTQFFSVCRAEVLSCNMSAIVHAISQLLNRWHLPVQRLSVFILHIVTCRCSSIVKLYMVSILTELTRLYLYYTQQHIDPSDAGDRTRDLTMASDNDIDDFVEEIIHLCKELRSLDESGWAELMVAMDPVSPGILHLREACINGN